jgi:hypothetical protein
VTAPTQTQAFSSDAEAGCLGGREVQRAVSTGRLTLPGWLGGERVGGRNASRCSLYRHHVRGLIGDRQIRPARRMTRHGRLKSSLRLKFWEVASFDQLAYGVVWDGDTGHKDRRQPGQGVPGLDEQVVEQVAGFGADLLNYRWTRDHSWTHRHLVRLRAQVTAR